MRVDARCTDILVPNCAIAKQPSVMRGLAKMVKNLTTRVCFTDLNAFATFRHNGCWKLVGGSAAWALSDVGVGSTTPWTPPLHPDR